MPSIPIPSLWLLELLNCFKILYDLVDEESVLQGGGRHRFGGSAQTTSSSLSILQTRLCSIPDLLVVARVDLVGARRRHARGEVIAGGGVLLVRV